MGAKISIVLYLIAAILHFINGQMTLFWLSVMLGIVSTGLGFYMSYHQISPEVKEFRDTVKQMEVDGASDDEILEFMDQDTDVDESILQDSTAWMVTVSTAGIVASFILLVIGVMGRF